MKLGMIGSGKSLGDSKIKIAMSVLRIKNYKATSIMVGSYDL